MTETAAPRRATTLERWLSTDPAFQGIGAARAARLTQAFGADLHHALCRRDARVTEVIPADVAERLFDAYFEKAQEALVADELSRLGVSPFLGTRLLRLWPHDATERIRANPFLLVSWVGWTKTEEIGKLLRVRPDEPCRLVAAVEAALYGRLDAKHTCASRSDLEALVSRLVGKEFSRRAVDLALEDGGCTAFGVDLIQPPGAAVMEAYVAESIERLLLPQTQADLLAVDVGKRQVIDALDLFESRQPFRLANRQREAVMLALMSRIACIGGYAGSGKTTILKAITNLAEGFGRELHLMALSGRASHRMAQATGRKATTIASFLKKHENDVLSPEALVVIDEASMLDLATLYRVLLRLGDARLLLVGDPAQLAPIGFGLTYHLLVKSPIVPTIVLDRVHRQSEASGIPSVAAAIRAGEQPDLAGFSGRKPGVTFVECPAEDSISRITEIGRVLRKSGVERDEIQILAPIRSGASGILAINQHFHEARGGDRKKFPGRSDIAVGDPVIFGKNDFELMLQNGSMGRLIDVEGGTAFVKFEDRVVELTANHRDLVELAYAISVHKAQGSQWPTVIVPLFASRLLDRTLLYTAVTRAQEQVVLVGDREAFRRALSLLRMEARETTLEARLESIAVK